MIKFKSKNINITPEKPARLTGMGFDDRSEGIHSDLDINAMIFNQENKLLFLISIDTLFISKELKKIIFKEISKHFGAIPEADIIIMSTHTHYAPSLEEKRIELGKLDEQYFDFLKIKIEELVNQLYLESFTEIEIEVSKGKTNNLTTNRRRRVRQLGAYFKPFIAMEPNLKGYKNEEFKIIKFYEKKDPKNILGVIWSFPCHLTNIYNSRLISAEFPGKIRNSIRGKLNNVAMPIIYMPGFAGDVRAYPPTRISISKLLRYIFQIPYRVYHYRFMNKSEYDGWVYSVENSFWKIWNQSMKINGFNEAPLITQLIKKNIEILGVKAEGVEDLIFRKINFGNILAFYTMSAETVSEYSKMINKIAKEEFYINTGYTDEVFGYLPTQEQIKEGGYESKDYFKTFLVSGNFKSSIENTIESCLKELN